MYDKNLSYSTLNTAHAALSPPFPKHWDNFSLLPLTVCFTFEKVVMSTAFMLRELCPNMIQQKVCKLLDDTNCVAVRVFTMGFSKAFNSLTNF